MNQTCRRLYVGNLGYHVTQAQVRDIFSAFGKLADVYAPPPLSDAPSSHIHRGYMFVEFHSPDDATRALATLSGTHDPSGRPLKLREADRKTQQPS